MSIEKHTITLEGREFVYLTQGALQYGDYIQSCPEFRANIALVRDDYQDNENCVWRECSYRAFHHNNCEWDGVIPDIIYVYGGYGYEAIMVREDTSLEELLEAFNAMTEYPLYDEMRMGEYEEEYKYEDWTSWMRHDVQTKVESALVDILKSDRFDVVDSLDLEEFVSSYFEKMDELHDEENRKLQDEGKEELWDWMFGVWCHADETGCHAFVTDGSSYYYDKRNIKDTAEYLLDNCEVLQSLLDGALKRTPQDLAQAKSDLDAALFS